MKNETMAHHTSPLSGIWEPALHELLEDPIMELLMSSDGLSHADLEPIISEVRRTDAAA